MDLTQKKCECTNFQEYKSLCAHGITACKYASLDPFKIFSKYHKLRVYHETYSWFLRPISIQDLESDPEIHPLIVRKQRGRPKSKRMQRGSENRKHKTCSTCGEKSRHDKRTCRNQPVQNGRRQQARDQEINDSLSDSLSNSLASDVQVDNQFQIEMALYDQRFSQGLLAAQRMQAMLATEQIEGVVLTSTGTSTGTGDSDSELSTVSSSRFSGLEEDWWKEKALEAAKTPGVATATVTVMRTRSKDKRVHWE